MDHPDCADGCAWARESGDFRCPPGQCVQRHSAEWEKDHPRPPQPAYAYGFPGLWSRVVQREPVHASADAGTGGESEQAIQISGFRLENIWLDDAPVSCRSVYDTEEQQPPPQPDTVSDGTVEYSADRAYRCGICDVTFIVPPDHAPPVVCRCRRYMVQVPLVSRSGFPYGGIIR